MPTQRLTSEILSGAIDGFEAQLAIAPAKRRRKMSAAARKRIAAAQRRRWAAFKKTKAAKARKQ